jgi:hypothetical protein
LEDDIGELAKVYPAPITNLPKVRTLFAAVTRTERRRIITAAKGYAAFIAECAKRKPGGGRAVKDADRWISNGMWQGYVVAGEKSEIAAMATDVALDSASGKAWRVVHRIAHLSEPFERGSYRLSRPMTEQELALAQAPPFEEWIFIAADKPNQVAAWDELVRGALCGRARPPIVNDRNRNRELGFMAPWPWPPRKDGSICTGPPEPGVSSDDQSFMDRNGLG